MPQGGGFKSAPLLIFQNGDYLLHQLDGFATATRANDINVRMRSIASLLTEEERQALAQYYGSGLGIVGRRTASSDSPVRFRVRSGFRSTSEASLIVYMSRRVSAGRADSGNDAVDLALAERGARENRMLPSTKANPL